MSTIVNRSSQRNIMLWLSVLTLAGLSVLTLVMQPARANWTGGIEGGTVVRSAANATRLRLVARNDQRPLSHFVFAEWLRFTNDENSFSVGYNPRYWLNTNTYVFGESEFGTDDIFRIDREITLVAGLGRQLISSEHQGLFVEVGAGGRSIELEDEDDANTEALGVARAGYFRTFAETIKLDASVRGIQSSEDISQLTSEVGVALRLGGGSVRVAYRNRFFKADDADSITDNDTFISYGYSF